MKSMKKLVTLLLSLVMLCALAMPAMAEGNDNYSITINGAVAGHTYTAYQVFKGAYYNGDRQVGKDAEYLSDVTWGDGVNSENLLTELKANGTLGTKFAAATTAEDVAYVLQNMTDKSAELDEFARIVGHNLTTPANTTGEVTKGAVNVKIENLAAGYYFVKDSDKIADGEIATKFLVEVVGKAEVTVKAQAPEFKKEIVKDNVTDNNKGTSVNVGDPVKFRLTANVPDMASFDDYTFTMHDTLSEGLTFNKDTVKVTVNGTQIVNTASTSDKYTLTYPATDTKETFTISFNKDQLKGYVQHTDNNTTFGATIVVEYTATLNEKALTRDVETNKALLEYTNDPSGNGTGTKKTPETPVYVYDFDIDIDKYDDTDNKDKDNTNKDKSKKLASAEFVLYKEVAEKNATVKYYYQWDVDAKAVKWVTEKDQATRKTTTAEGKTSFQGIAAGDYFLEETKAPDGYNKLKDPKAVTITAEYKEDGELLNTSANDNTTANGQYIQKVEVPNKAGAVLPSTGGIGTTIFYVLGSILALGAAVLLIAKKRMNGQDR